MPIERFESRVKTILKHAGWNDHRSIPLPSLPEEYTLFEAAERVLKEFGGLHPGEVGPGENRATSDVEYDPGGACGLSDVTGLTAPNGMQIFPLGEFQHGHAYLFIDEAGHVYSYFDELDHLADSHDEALSKLLLGRL